MFYELSENRCGWTQHWSVVIAVWGGERSHLIFFVFLPIEI